MKSSVPLPCSRMILARSKALRRSATPEKIAESCSKLRFVSFASSRAIVVLPEPGGPQKMRLGTRPLFSMRVSVPSGPTMWSWPATSSRVFGRRRSASGRGALFSSPAASKRLVMTRIYRGPCAPFQTRSVARPLPSPSRRMTGRDGGRRGRYVRTATFTVMAGPELAPAASVTATSKWALDPSEPSWEK